MDQHQQALVEQAARIVQKAQRQIWVRFQQEGIHRYPAALTDPTLATGDEYDVSFLGYPHRHIFHFKVWISVEHSDREIEFIQFKRWLQQLYKNTTNKDLETGVLDLNNKSCEMIADDLYAAIVARYPDRSVWIEVSEDGENGCFIKYETHQPNLKVKI